MSSGAERSFLSIMSGNEGSRRFLRWLVIVALTWCIPAAIIWTGVKLFVSERINHENSRIFDEINHDLDNFIYDSLPTRFFYPRFNSLLRQLKGLPSNRDVLEKIIEGFESQWPAGMLEIYLFNGDGGVLPIHGAREEHEIFFKMATADDQESAQVSPEQLNQIGKILPAPDLMLSRIRDQRDRVVELGNPDRFSLCFFDCDKSIKNRFVAGMLIFVHLKHLKVSDILDVTVSKVKPTNFGFINDDGTRLPTILADHDKDTLIDYYQQYPTNAFILKNKLISLKRFDEYTLLLGAYDAPCPPTFFLGILLLGFIGASIFFLKLSYRIIVLQIRFQHNIRQRLVCLFALCYGLPLIAAVFMSVQYLIELKHSLIIEEKQENYRRLAEIDAGFTRFSTARLLEFRKFTEDLKKVVTSPDELKARLKEKYNEFVIDNVHMVSSQSEVIYSNDIMTAEVRRHYNSIRTERQKILESWKARHANISPRHLKALFDGPGPDGFPPEPEKTEGHGSFVKIFTSTALAAMDYYNRSHGIFSPLQRNASNLVIDTLIESNTHTLFQSARTNISRFTNIQGLDEIFLAYLDVLPGPSSEAWYAFAMLIDLVNFERQYFEKLFGDLKSRSVIMNRVFPEEDIRAVSMHQYAVNYPSVLEFKKFEAIIRRSNTDFKTFTQLMKVDGRDSYVSVLRGSYLKHYLLLKISPVDKLEAIFKKRVNVIVIIFAVVLIMGLALARLLTRLLILPINDIMHGVKALAERNYQYRIPVRSENEFGILAKAFNESAAILKRLTISEKIRKQLYPETEFRCGSYLIATANSNSRIILSDFFDYIPLKQGTYALILAEVSGNDISAAYLTAMLKTSFTLLCPCFPLNPEIILEKLNQIFLPYYKKGHMTTCMIGIIDPTNDKIICANAGQSYPVCISEKSGEKAFISLPSTPLGLHPDTKFRKHEIELENRTLVLYSDGAVNLLDQNGEKLGHEKFLEIVQQSIKTDSRNPSEEITRRLNAVSMNVPWRDDITIMCIQNRI
ncbi:MAG: HAMP domain-containing protein [Erysipelotrichia bacterium]|nr:HAMP domain-containing protein [Erysipelotrichia bacterium]